MNVNYPVRSPFAKDSYFVRKNCKVCGDKLNLDETKSGKCLDCKDK